MKFEDDKIKSFYADLKDEYHALKVEMTFKYGTAEITLPDIDLPQINTDGFSFTANTNGGYSVSGMGEVNVTDLVIPATYNGEPVTEIAERRCQHCFRRKLRCFARKGVRQLRQS